MSDPSWNNGLYYDNEYPVRGMRLARLVNATFKIQLIDQ